MTGPVIEDRFQSMRAAYEGVESEFRDPAELAAYRQSLTGKSEAQAAFIARRASGGGSGVEVACGNGRLLFALRDRGVLDSGLGIDLADSRIRFARAWAADLGRHELEFASGNALDLPLGRDHTLALCVTGAFGYFDAYASESAAQLLRRLRDALRPGGLLVLELYQQTLALRLTRAAGGRVRTWMELPKSDPWRFYLSENSLEGNVIVHRKTFVHRSNGTVDDGRVERMAVYTPEQLEALLASSGYSDIELSEGWTDHPYGEGDVLVAVARRQD